MENSISLKTIANEYKKCIQLIPFFTMCMNTSSNLNKPSDRFAKGGLREKGLEIYSGGRLKWIDEEGRDNRDTVLNKDIEFKTTPLKTKTGNNKKNISARLKNTMGNNAKCSIKNPADIYMFGGCHGLMICDYETMIPYFEQTNDALVCKIPFEKLTPIAFSSEYKTQIENKLKEIKEIPNVNYVKMRHKMEMDFLNNFV